MTLDLDNMTQAEFDELMAEIKERNPNLFGAYFSIYKISNKLEEVRISLLDFSHLFIKFCLCHIV